MAYIFFLHLSSFRVQTINSALFQTFSRKTAIQISYWGVMQVAVGFQEMLLQKQEREADIDLVLSTLQKSSYSKHGA
jgi:hypothetical protein